jgi:AGZA family xanthine/uracil permease-like MFS transporter
MFKAIDKFFHVTERGSNIRNEILGGIVMFLAGAYILAVNPNILTASGLAMGPTFTATALAAGAATILMAFLANVPIFLASGMGLNAFFTYTVCLGMGIAPALALLAVLIEGVIFILLTVFNVRKYIVDAIPANLRKAICIGIGLFIALIGFINAGIVVKNDSTVLSFGNLMAGGTMSVALIGLALTSILYAAKVPGSLLIGIFATAAIGIPFGVTDISLLGQGWGLPAAPTEFFNAALWHTGAFPVASFIIVVFTFLFTDIFDTMGTVLGVTKAAGLQDKNGEVDPKTLKRIFLVDAIGTTAGAVLGTSTVTSYVESTTATTQGAKTGLAALVTGLLFIAALFISPIFLFIPSAATAPALILVGFLMMGGIKDINFDDPTEGIPAFITMVTMPFAYSIAAGIEYGVLSYVLIKLFTGKVKDISIPTWVVFAAFAAHKIFLPM